MSFTQYQWTDRHTEHGNRRIITDVDTGTFETVDVERAEGTTYNKPSEDVAEFNASNMNDIETRIAQAFTAAAAKKVTILNTIYPVGSIYISMNNVNPANVLGGGTWQSISGGILLPSNNCNLTPQGSDTSSYKPTGTVNYSLNCNTGYAEVPSHNHDVRPNSDSYIFSWGDIADGSGYHQAVSTGSISEYITTSSAGNGGGHNHNLSVSALFTGNTQSFDNRMPSITVYAWRRTA